MNSKFKAEAWKVFMVASFLFITIFFILPYLIQISTFFHERAHQKALDHYGIENSYSLNLLETIPNFFNPKVNKLGVTRFDLKKYNLLNSNQKADVNLAGIISDLKFLFLIAVYLALINVYTYYKVVFKKNYNLIWILAVNWVLFMWLLALVQITVANISYSSGDVYMLVKAIR